MSNAEWKAVIPTTEFQESESNGEFEEEMRYFPIRPLNCNNLANKIFVVLVLWGYLGYFGLDALKLQGYCSVFSLFSVIFSDIPLSLY